MGLKWYAWVFAVVTVFACGVLLPVVQINTLASSMQTAFELPPLLIAAGIAAPLALIIFGGIKRIASFAEMVVPLDRTSVGVGKSVSGRLGFGGRRFI